MFGVPVASDTMLAAIWVLTPGAVREFATIPASTLPLPCKGDVVMAFYKELRAWKVVS